RPVALRRRARRPQRQRDPLGCPPSCARRWPVFPAHLSFPGQHVTRSRLLSRSSDALLMAKRDSLHRLPVSRKLQPSTSCRRERSPTTKGTKRQGCSPPPDGIAGFGTAPPGAL